MLIHSSVSVLFSLLFMIMHLPNPEIMEQATLLQGLMAALTYFLIAAVAYMLCFAIGNLMLGIVYHWINNFLNFTFFGPEDGVLAPPSLFQ